MTPAERKAAQRRRDRLAGWTEVTVRIDANQAEAVRTYAASLPPPAPPTDPAQLSLLDQLDAMLSGDMSRGGGGEGAAQGSLF
ncbi:MAG: hypothetical protein Q4P24_16530 [Rhodobacterales bacterium]|nr:hypothetical protein [Rhodobacterales bacterium]